MARRTSLTSGLAALEIVSGLGILQCVWDKNSADETHRMECGGGGVLSGDARDVLDFDQNRAAGGARRGAAGRRDHAAHGIAVGHRGERRVPYLPREEDARRQGTDCVWVATAGACARHFAGAMELCEAGRRVFVVVVRGACVRGVSRRGWWLVGGGG